MQWPIIPIKNLTSLFPLIFLPKHICVYALGRIKWILGIIWPWNQHSNLKNQRNWKKQVWMLNFLIGIICILLHWWKKLTLVPDLFWPELYYWKLHWLWLTPTNSHSLERKKVQAREELMQERMIYNFFQRTVQLYFFLLTL